MEKLKVVLLLSLAFLFGGQTNAQTVSEGDARAKALEFFSNGAKKLPARNGAKRQAPAVSNVELAYTSQKEGKTCFYVFNNGTDGGFVIVGGDEAAKEILAYSDHGHFDYDKVPANFKNLLNQYAEQISLAKPVKSKYMAKASSATVQKEDIADLIETTWDQWNPYNRAIPKLVNSNTGEEFTPPTGCVQTAVAQIMKYWNYPEHGVGHNTRVLDYSQINGYTPGDASYTPEFGTVVHDINFAETTYDWENMLNNYTGSETEEQIKAVSTLMYHAGVACQAVWGVNETTGAYPEEGLKTYYGYSSKATALERDQFDDVTWEELIYGELSLKRPVLYSGAGDDGIVGHEYIIHGYSSDIDMYKVNWGWGGFLDCYCKLTPTSGHTFLGYDNHQSAIVRLQPETLDSENTLDYGDIFWVDGFKYKIISSVYKTAEVLRPEENEPQARYIGNISLPSVVNYQGDDYSVIIVGKEAFSYVTPDLWDEHPTTDIPSLSNNLRIIRFGAFASCNRITDVVIPDNVSILEEYAFSNCVHLKDISFPSNLKEIKRDCFWRCLDLTRIVIPEGTKTIGGDAFELCDKLGYVEFPSTLDSLSSGVFHGCDNIDVMVCKAATPPATDAYSTPFANSVNNGYLLVPGASIDLYKAARYWKDWKNIVPIESTDLSMIGETITIDNIEYKIIPSGAEVKKVLYSSPTITIPDVINVNNIDYQVVSIGSNALEYSINCDTVVLPQYLTTIKSHAFNSCNAKVISIPNSVTSIGNGAFLYCENLERIRIPDLIEDVSFYWFYGCKNLCIIELSQNVKKVDPCEGLPNLFTLVCHSEDVPSDNLIRDIYSCCVEGTLYVPSASIEQYRNSEYWKNWRFIKSIDEFDVDEQLVIVTENGLQYRILNHGAVVLRPIGEKEDLIIPESIEYEGQSYDVISIAEEAFRYGFYGPGYNIKSVHLPASMHSIMKYAFFNHTELNGINLSDNITYIGYGAFEGCTNLKNVVLPDSLKVMYEPFCGTAIEKLIIPEGTISIGDGLSFFRMENLKELVYPSTLELKWNYGIGFRELEDVYVLTPSFANVWSVSGKKVYVPSDLVETCKNHDNWSIEEVLPIVPLTSVILNENNVEITSGETTTLAADFSPVDASLKYVKWTSSDPAIASVDYNGVVTAHKAGTATITATGMYYPEISSSCSVTVTAALPEGDVNGDGKVDVIDINAIVNVILDNTSAGNKDGLTDVNGDGKTDVIDINALINIILGQ